MADTFFAKLVRDRIPAIMKATGSPPEMVRRLQGQQLRAALLDKLDEERSEIAASKTDAEALAELADAREVLAALAAWHGYSMADVDVAAEVKRERCGGFDAGLWVEGHDRR